MKAGFAAEEEASLREGRGELSPPPVLRAICRPRTGCGVDSMPGGRKDDLSVSFAGRTGPGTAPWASGFLTDYDDYATVLPATFVCLVVGHRPILPVTHCSQAGRSDPLLLANVMQHGQ